MKTQHHQPHEDLLGPEVSRWVCLDLPPHAICFPSGSGTEGPPEVCGPGSRSFVEAWVETHSNEPLEQWGSGLMHSSREGRQAASPKDSWVMRN